MRQDSYFRWSIDTFTHTHTHVDEEMLLIRKAPFPLRNNVLQIWNILQMDYLTANELICGLRGRSINV